MKENSQLTHEDMFSMELDHKIDQIVRIKTDRYKSQLIHKNMIINMLNSSLEALRKENKIVRFFLAMTTTYSVIVSLYWWVS